MAKRITESRLISWMQDKRIIGIPIGIALVIFMAYLGSIEVLSYTGDIYHDGTAQINITFEANEDIFIYPMEASYSLLEFDNPEAVHLVKMYRTWGSGLRELNLSKRCTGSWCGCGWCTKSNTAKFVYAFREGKEYTIVYDLKLDPKADVKWSFLGDLVDPYLIGEKTTDDVFTELKEVDKNGIMQFEMYAPSKLEKGTLDVTFNEVQGSIKDYKIKILKNFTKNVPDYSMHEVCTEIVPNGTKDVSTSTIKVCHNESYISGSHTEIYQDWGIVDSIPYGKADYKIKADIQPEYYPNCPDDAMMCYAIDAIPILNTGIETFEQVKWVWWNASYDSKRTIDCSKMSDGVPLVINGSGGFDIDGDNQIVWTYCAGENTSLYYNAGNSRSYAVANDTSALPFEVELGNGTSHNPTSVWSGYKAVWLLNNTLDSTSNNVDGTSHATQTTSGKINGAYSFTRTSSEYLDFGDVASLENDDFTLRTWAQRDGSGTADVLMTIQQQSDSGTGRAGVLWWINSANQLELYVCYNNGFYSIKTTDTITDTDWHYYVGTKEGTTIKLYADGVLNASGNLAQSTVDWTTSAQKTLIGAYLVVSPTEFYDGKIDMSSISSSIDTASEVNQTYQNTIGTEGFGTLGASESNPNTAPTNVLRIDPTTANIYSDLSGYCNGTDADGDNITYFYEWFRDNVTMYSGSFTNNTAGNPVPVGSYNDSEGVYSLAGANSVFVSGDYAYTVSSLNDTLSVWDISAHGNPVPVGSVTDSEGAYSLDLAWDVVVSGDYAYTVSYTDDTLSVWDISAHGNPVPVGSYTDSEGANSLEGVYAVAVSGDYVYTVSYTDDTLSVWDISSHGNPVPVGFVTDSGGDNSLDGVISVYVSGDYAYTGTYNDGTLSVWDISGHGNPVPVGSYTDMVGDYSLDRLRKIKVQGDYAYTISEEDHTFAVWNISGHGGPVPVGTITDTASPGSLAKVYGLFVSGDYAYTVSQLHDNLLVWNISGHGNPVLLGEVSDSDGANSLDKARDVFIYGDYAYTVSYTDDTLSVWDIGNGFVQGIEQLVNTLPSSYTESNDEWTFLCHAYDGEDFSTWSNTSLTINDTCVYIGSGDWDININDNCTLNTNTDVGSNKIKFYGDVGHTLITARIFAKDILYEPDDFDGDTMIGVETGGILAAQIP